VDKDKFNGTDGDEDGTEYPNQD